MMSTSREFAASVRRTILGTFDPSGRSTRLDLAFWWFANAALSIVLDAGIEPMMTPGPDRPVARWIIEFIGIIPFFALFARRMHDQDRTGWWVLLLPPLTAVHFYDTVRVNYHAFDPTWPALGYGKIPLFACAIGYVVLMLLPGTIGANRHGPDPRSAEKRAEA